MAVAILSTATSPEREPEVFPLVAVREHDQLVIEPLATDGYESSRTSGSITHQILGKPEPDITIRPATLRTGTLTFWFDDEEASLEAEEAHAEGGLFYLEHGVRQTVLMRYVPTGTITRSLERSTGGAWIVTVEYTEVSK